MVRTEAEAGSMIRGFAGTGRPVLLGITERHEFVDAPGHLTDLARYRARGVARKGTGSRSARIGPWRRSRCLHRLVTG